MEEPVLGARLTSTAGLAVARAGHVFVVEGFGRELARAALQARGPAYVDYVRRTSAFLPCWSKAATAV
jgi:steroid 5-alpha reductase family enzyme